MGTPPKRALFGSSFSLLRGLLVKWETSSFSVLPTAFPIPFLIGKGESGPKP